MTYAPPPYPEGVNPDVFYSCTRKLYLQSEFLADNWATLLGFAFPDDDRPFQAYGCRHCDGWHVGHAPRGSR